MSEQPKQEPTPDQSRKLYDAVNEYLAPSGWYMLVAGPCGVRKIYSPLGESQDEYSFEFVVRFTGGRK